jgi:hypothetical protein
MDIFHQKSGRAIPFGEECGSAVVIFEQPAHFSDEPPSRKAFLRTIQADLSCTLLFAMRHAWM